MLKECKSIMCMEVVQAFSYQLNSPISYVHSQFISINNYYISHTFTSLNLVPST